MDKMTYIAMLQGLTLTILKKQSVLGIEASEEEVLELLLLMEGMETFWNADSSLNSETALVQKFINKTRKIYQNEWRLKSG